MEDEFINDSSNNKNKCSNNNKVTIKIYFLALKKMIPLISPVIAGVAVALLIIVNSYYDNARRDFYNWKKNIISGMTRGSEIAIHSLFSTSPEGLGLLYDVLNNSEIEEYYYRQQEMAILLLKMPIYKKTITCEPKRNNFNFVIKSVLDESYFSDNLTKLKQKIYIEGLYNSMRAQETESDTFNLYFEPGIDPVINFEEINIRVSKGKNAFKLLSRSDFSIRPLGTKDLKSPLYELAIPIGLCRNNEKVTITVDIPEIVASARYKDINIPFSLYDFHIERYYLGVKKFKSILNFDQDVWLYRICLEKDDFLSTECYDDVNIVHPEGYTNDIPIRKFAFEMSNPNKNIDYAFFKKPPLITE